MNPVRKAAQLVVKELVEALPPALFFFVVFEVIVLLRRWMGAADGIYLTTVVTALVGALLVAKAVLIFDSLPLARLFRGRPLVYHVLWRSLLYLLFALVLQSLEEIVSSRKDAGGLWPAATRFVSDTHWPHFWATHVMLGVFLIFYAVITTLIELIGRERFLRIFFGIGKPDGGDGAAAGR